MPLPSALPRRVAALTVAVTLAAGTAGCADFSEQEQAADAGTFSEAPPMQPAPRAPRPPSTDDEIGEPPTGPCVDPDPAVIATCLEPTAGLRPADPDGRTVYVAERTTGKIILSKRYGPQRVVATVPVDSSGDGGLIDFELSPTWSEDQMIFALITTPSDNRVVRIAPTGSIKPVLTGIPKGPTGNMGSISFATATELTVATGDAGNPSAARNRSSLAGKVFTINPGHIDPKPVILASGMGSNVALCRVQSTGELYVADSGAAGDRLSMVTPKATTTLWTWADRPGLTGCAASTDWISVSVAAKQRIDVFQKPNGTGTATAPNEQDFAKSYGAVGRMTAGEGVVIAATINKENRARKKPVSTDDRAVIWSPSPAEDRL